MSKNPLPRRIIFPAISDQELPDPCQGGYERYTDFAPLNQGGGAILETAIDGHLGREVVFKKLLPEFRQDEVMIKRFLREARVTALIQHPATVPVYEIGRDPEGTPYFTMKKIEGHSLQEILKGVIEHDKTFDAFASRDTVIDLLITVGQAIAYAHESGVIHRDIKPGNIVIGDFGEVVVMDWGIAKVVGEKDEQLEDPHSDLKAPADDLTVRGKVYGTPRYMSPEQAKGEDDIDHRSDVFSFGAVLFEVLCHRPLFYGANREEVLHQVLHRRIKSPRKLEPMKMIPNPLNEICMHALEKHPDDRYQSMAALIEDLQNYRVGRGISIIEHTPWQKMMQWNRSHFNRLSWLMLLIGLGLGWLLSR